MDEAVQEALQVQSSLKGTRRRVEATLGAPCPCGVAVGRFCFPSVGGFHRERWFGAAAQAFGGVR